MIKMFVGDLLWKFPVVGNTLSGRCVGELGLQSVLQDSLHAFFMYVGVFRISE